MRRRSPVLGRSVVVASLLALATVIPAGAQSPLPVPSAEALPVPSATPFPYPTFTTPPTARSLGRFVPSGPPDARTQRDGIRVELWLDRTTAAPGEWILGRVRVTNTRSDDAWSPGACGPMVRVTPDLAGVLDPGIQQTGAAALFKAAILDSPGAEPDPFRQLRWRGGEPIAWSGPALAMLDCGGEGDDVTRLAPGSSIDADVAWFPAEQPTGDDVPIRPLPPGPVTVTATYELIKHGAQPRRQFDGRPITASTVVTLTGDDPGLPSTAQLVDAAIADPTVDAWLGCVTPDKPRAWTAFLGGWGRLPYPEQQRRYQGLGALAPDGVTELVLMVDSQDPGGTLIAMLDPWTGSVVRVVEEGATPACATGTAASPGPSSAP